MPEEYRVEATKIIQGSMEFYCFVMNSKSLRDVAFVSRREPANPSGYQRYLNTKRLKEVGDYIKRPRATFPNSIIVNFEPGKVRFESSGTGNKGVLIIPKNENTAWIIDGQHRLYGFIESAGKEFDLVVTAFLGLALQDQAVIFKTINSEQKGVNPSLIYDLIELTKDAEFTDERAHEIVKALNEHEDSPWRSSIKMIGMGKGTISQAAFVTEIKTLLSDAIFKEYPAGEQAKILKDYFSSIKDLYPSAWGNKRYVLCKTLGVASLLRIMPKVLIHCRVKNDFSKKWNVCHIKGFVKLPDTNRNGF